MPIVVMSAVLGDGVVWLSLGGDARLLRSLMIAARAMTSESRSAHLAARVECCSQ